MQLFRVWLALGAVLGGLAVAAAAYAAHANVDPARARALASAVQMQGWHALALVAVGLVGARAAGGRAGCFRWRARCSWWGCCCSAGPCMCRCSAGPPWA